MFRPSPQLYPFTSRWLETSLGRLHYIDEGRGPPLLFLHGNPTWSFLYRQIIDRLRLGHRCIAVDYPGFGLSEHPPGYGYTPAEHARAVLELVERLDPPELAMVGHDWGGPIGVWVALQVRERLSHLVLMNTTYGELGHPWLRAFSLCLSSPPLQWAIRRGNLFVEWVLPLGMAVKLGRDEMDHYRSVLPTPQSRRGVAELPRQLRLARRWVEGWARRVPAELGDVPLLLLWGLRDPLFRPRFMEAIRRDFQHVAVRALPGARHFVPEDAPVEAAAAIAEFLA